MKNLSITEFIRLKWKESRKKRLKRIKDFKTLNTDESIKYNQLKINPLSLTYKSILWILFFPLIIAFYFGIISISFKYGLGVDITEILLNLLSPITLLWGKIITAIFIFLIIIGIGDYLEVKNHNGELLDKIIKERNGKRRK